MLIDKVLLHNPANIDHLELAPSFETVSQPIKSTSGLLGWAIQQPEGSPHLGDVYNPEGRYPLAVSHSASAPLYLHNTSARLSSKSQGATRTMSSSLTHILLFIFPLILHSLVLLSMQSTMIRSPPESRFTRPRSSPSEGFIMFLRFASLKTFLFPN